MWMLRSLFGKTLLPGSGSLIPSSRIMVFSLTISPSGDTAMTWELQIDILPQLILTEMDKPRLFIGHSESTQEKVG